MFGQCNHVIWEQQKELALFQLQEYVSQSFASTPDHLLTPNMSTFMSMVVAPCLRINVSSIDSSLASVSAQFVQALANRRLTEACQITPMF